jgi:hypothetical protein
MQVVDEDDEDAARRFGDAAHLGNTGLRAPSSTGRISVMTRRGRGGERRNLV